MQLLGFLRHVQQPGSESTKQLAVLVDWRKVDAHMATNVPGLFAAGDCTGGLLQVAKAVYQGAEAGLAAVRYLRSKNGN